MQAVLQALGDAGIDAKEIDGLVRYDAPNELVNQGLLIRALGIPEVRWLSNAPYGGEATGAVISHAAAAIAAGQASVVVVYRSLSQSTSGRMGRADTRYGSERRGVRQRRPHPWRRIQRTVRPAVTGPGLRAVGQPLQVRKRRSPTPTWERALGTFAIQQRAVRAHQSSRDHEGPSADAGTTTTTRA